MAATAPQTLDDPFQRALYGMLYGIMRWDQLAQFWEKVDAGAGWYLYAVGTEAPAQPADAEHAKKFMRDLDSLLRQEHQEDYCGIVYADNLDKPSFIKVYDPNHLGSSCGSSKNPPLPGWVMSLVPPSALNPSVVPQSRRRWWQGFLDSLK